jgi:coenzyme F420-0:L-glutamate ligase/coenzyme F420-1:gamma-L-glutamate ligase
MDYQELLALIKSRRSVRQFSARKLAHAQIDGLIEAARWAPSNHNRQGWKFIVFQDAVTIAGLAEQVRTSVRQSLQAAPRLVAARADEIIHFAGAFDRSPVVILAMHKASPTIGKSLLTGATSDLASGEAISTAMACQNILLAAHAMGLGACVMTAPLLAADVWKTAALPAGFEATCLIAAGYPALTPEPPRRKSLEQITEYRGS